MYFVVKLLKKKHFNSACCVVHLVMLLLASVSLNFTLIFYTNVFLL